MNSLVTSLPLVSVVIPLYNHQAYVPQCLNSLLVDDYSPIEVLIMDDGSSDGSYETAERWRRENRHAFSRFLLMRQANQGAARTCNSLISMSKGAYIAPLASDDLLVPGGLRTRVEYLIKHPKMMAVMGDCVVISETSTRVSDSALFKYRKSDPLAFRAPESFIDELILRWNVPGPVLLLRREVFFGADAVGFYSEDGGIEDRDFFLRLLQRNVLGFIPQQVAAYRVHVANSCRPITPAARLSHYKSRLISERKHIGLFRGKRRLYLRLASPQGSLVRHV